MKWLKKSLCLLLSICLLSAGLVLQPAVSAAEDAVDTIEISLPVITGENGLLWYTMDNPTGTTVLRTETDGTPRDSIALSGTFLPEGGRLGGAMQLNGVHDYVQLNNDDIGASGFLHGEYAAETVSFWIRPDHLNGRQMLYKQGGDIGGMAIRIHDGYLEAAVATGAPNLLSAVKLPEDAAGKWMHILLCFERGKASLYLDGELVSSKATSAAKIPAARRAAALGRNLYPANAFGENQAGDDQWYAGRIDDLRIYSVAATPQRVVQSIELPAPLSLPYGATIEDIVLPDTVTLHFSKNQKTTCSVSAWECDGAFDGTAADVYTFVGHLALADGLSNDRQLTPLFHVVVNDAQNSLHPTLEVAATRISDTLFSLGVTNDTEVEALIAATDDALANLNCTVKWESTPSLTPATKETDGQLAISLTLTADGREKALSLSLPIPKLDEIVGSTYLQCADQKNHYIYKNNQNHLTVGSMIPEVQRAFTVVSGLGGEGISFQMQENGTYLTATENALTLSRPVTAAQKAAATFIEEEPLGEKPGWANVFAGGFYSYRLANSGLYLTHTGDGISLSAAGETAAERLAATFKRTGDQTPTPIESMRGAVYYPNYAYNAYQFFKYYDAEIIARDMTYARRLGINAYRIWVSYEYWLEDPEHFEAAYNDFLNKADAAGIQILVSLFDGCGEAFNEKTRARYYADSYCITSPSAEIFNNPDRYDEPLAFVRWFMERYKNDTRQLGIEIYNEPWGQNRANLATYLCKEAVKLQGCVPLSGGTAPASEFSIPLCVEIGMDLIQYHDNFPGSAAAFESNALTRIRQSESANMPVYCTEIQWVSGPTKYPQYENLASTVNRLAENYEWAPFYWTLMVHPGYLKEIRNKVDMTNGILQEDGNPWSTAAATAIAPEKDLSSLTDNQKSAFTQYSYTHTFSDDFLDQKGYKWETCLGFWTAEDGCFFAIDTSKIKASLTEFGNLGILATVSPTEEGTAGVVLRAGEEDGGYFGGIVNGQLCIGKVLYNRVIPLVREAIAAQDSYAIALYADRDTLTLVCKDTVLTANDSEYSTGALGILATAGGSVDDFSASVTHTLPEKPSAPGDLDADGQVTVSDVVLLRQRIVLGDWSKQQLSSGDLDTDGQLTISDVVLLRQRIVSGG